MFHIVSFLETNEVEVVPSSWVDGDQCVWPRLRGESLTKAVKLAMKPKKEWKIFKVKLLYTTDNYDDARKKLPEAELFSDIQSDTESGAKKPRRIMKSFRLQNFKLLSDSDDDDDNEGQNLKGLEPPPRIKPPAFQTFSQSTQRPSSARQQPPLCQPASQPPASDQSPFYQPASQPPASDQFLFYQPASQPPAWSQPPLQQLASQPLLNHQPSLLQLNSQPSLDYLQPAGSESGIRRNQPLQILLREILTKQEMLLDQQNTIMRILQSTHRPRPDVHDGAKFRDRLPVKDVESLQCLEAELKMNPDSKSELITYLGLVGGFDLKDTVWRVLKATFTTPVARGMNWRGVNGKIGVQRLVVKEVIIGAVRQNPLTEKASNKDIEFNIIKWLHLAGDREGGEGAIEERRGPTKHCRPSLETSLHINTSTYLSSFFNFINFSLKFSVQVTLIFSVIFITLRV
uniref:DUF4806 domain-containing protein n=1 Tax=Cyprinus carpio carpio TaxID=630221 RepID=A0A9J8CWV3_CYPCA